MRELRGNLVRRQNGFSVLITLFLLALVVIVVIAVTTRARQAKKPLQSSQTAQTGLRGVAFTPRGSDTAGFFSLASKSFDTVAWHGDWQDLGGNHAPATILTLANQNHLTPVILTGTHTDAGGGKVVAIRPIDAANYKQMAVDFAKQYKPPYFGLGNEVNRIYASQPADFEVLVGLFNDTAAAIKAVSPNTKVFTVFQLEQLKGLNGGLFGGVNDPSKAQWQLLDRFNQADIIAFTTYPGLIYHDPSQIPADYYSEIATHSTKPVAFSEVGWSAGQMASGWDSTPTTQNDFAKRFLQMTESLKPVFSDWLALYDPSTKPPFNLMGLYDNQGQPRPAFDTWKSK